MLPTHDVELRWSGDATIITGPGEIRRQLVELLMAALGDPDRGDLVELVVGDGVVTAGAGHELRL